MSSSQAKPSRSDSDDRRQIILKAAQDLIVRQGLEGFRIREVADRAGMHHASLLHYFPSREALVRDVVERIVAQLDSIPTASSSETQLAPREALHAHFQHVLSEMQTHPEAFIALNELFLRAMRDDGDDCARLLSDHSLAPNRLRRRAAQCRPDRRVEQCDKRRREEGGQ